MKLRLAFALLALSLAGCSVQKFDGPADYARWLRANQIIYEQTRNDPNASWWQRLKARNNAPLVPLSEACMADENKCDARDGQINQVAEAAKGNSIASSMAMGFAAGSPAIYAHPPF
jgi:hypothetical protein